MKSYFGLEGVVKEYDGSILELRSAISDSEWNHILSGTISCVAFMEACRDTACPKLDIEWSEEDAETLKKLTSSMHRMRDVDPLLFAKANSVDYKTAYSKKMEDNAPEVLQMVEDVQKSMIRRSFDANNGGSTIYGVL